jgi:hypothetical protein
MYSAVVNCSALTDPVPIVTTQFIWLLKTSLNAQYRGLTVFTWIFTHDPTLVILLDVLPDAEAQLVLKIGNIVEGNQLA